MTAFFAPALILAFSIILFSTKTEHSRVVTIQKPIVINQERKTPAYFAYQQSQQLFRKKQNSNFAKSTYLGNFSVLPPAPKYQLAEMKFTKTEFAQNYNTSFRPRTIAGDLYNEMSSLVYEKVVYNQTTETPLRQIQEDVPALSPSKKWATIRGKFELRDGVGIVDHQIEIKRIEEGLVRELGRINLQDGSYSIDIESPNGYLIAQIKDRAGLIIGEDRQRLVNLQNKGGFFEGPFIRVGMPDTLAVNLQKDSSSKPASKPSTNLASLKTNAKTIENSSALAISIFDNQKTLSFPTEEFSNISKFSSTIARFYDAAQIYASLTTIRHTGDNTETPMLTKNWLERAKNFISENTQMQLKNKALPVIIGRVLIDGQPAANMQAMIENHPSVKAVYFDQFLNPTSALNKTSAGGYFMFIGLEENTYNVVVMNQNKIIGSQLFIAELDSVAFQNINTKSIPTPLTIRTFDAFNSDPVESEILSSLQEEAFQTAGGFVEIKTNVENNVSEFIINSQNPEYIITRYTQSGKKDYVHAPMLRRIWINEIKRLRLINEIPGTGSVIGFTPNIKSEAYLVLENYNKNNVVYFDKYGQISPVSVMGGGFVLFNVPAGAREVILQDSGNERIYSQTFNVISEQTSVTHFTD